MPPRIEEGAEIGAFHMWKFAGFDDKGDSFVTIRMVRLYLLPRRV